MAINWLSRATECYEASTTYVDANYRKKWEYDLRAFQNEHAPGSKYLSDEYKGRSKLFRPKTRSIIRKGEAATFMTIGNIDDLEIEAEDPDNLFAVASAQAMKAILDYRLTKTIPWPLLVAGGFQDASSVGVVCSYNYWDYKKRARDGKLLADQPCIELRPVENIRIDACADWLNPVKSSPYFIDIIPMYVGDVKQMMTMEDDKTGAPKWKKYDEGEILKAAPDMLDSTRQIRQGRGMQDAFLEKRSLDDHDLVWVMKFFMREAGDDMCFYTLGTHQMLTDPKPVEEVYFHGERPYTLGCVVLEAHKAVPDGPTWMVRDLQREMNENVNSRMDNVKLILNKRYLVGRGRQVDIQSLLRNVPGGVTMATNPKEDVIPLEWNDVTASAYMEQEKLGQDFDDLIGYFSPNSRFANKGMSETLGGSKLAMQGASQMTEYQIQTLVKTWVEPTLRQLVLLEQYYETDEKILALAGQQMAKAFPQFGGGAIPDTMLMQELLLTVNFGMGATDPQERLQKFIYATQAANQVISTSPPGANVGEMVKEIYRNAGYRNGSRFFPTQGGDPRLAMAFQQIQQLQGELQSKRYEIDTNAKVQLQKVAVERQSIQEETMVNAQRIQLDGQIRNKEADIKALAVQVDAQGIQGGEAEQALKIQGQQQSHKMQMREHALKIAQLEEQVRVANIKAEEAAVKLALEKQKMDHEQAQVESNEQRISTVADGVGKAMQDVGQQVIEIKDDLKEAMKTAEKVQGLQEAMLEMARGITVMAGSVDQMRSKPKPTGFSKKKGEDGRKSIVIVFDDGSQREMTEQ